ncbi:MAG: hypothetical protein ACXADH_04495 [Candidatus Kariarchaeaceae archaeon]
MWRGDRGEGCGRWGRGDCGGRCPGWRGVDGGQGDDDVRLERFGGVDCTRYGIEWMKHTN